MTPRKWSSFLFYHTHSLILRCPIVTISPLTGASLSLPTMIWRYVRQFVKMDPKEALQYVYCVCLSSDQTPSMTFNHRPAGATSGPGNTFGTLPTQQQTDIGKEQIHAAWALVRRIIVLGNSGPGWEELVGGFRPSADRNTPGTRFSGVIEQAAESLLGMKSLEEFNREILVPSAKESLEADRIAEAVQLYNLAGEYNTVVAVLAQALGNGLSLAFVGEGGEGGEGGERGKEIERVARGVLREYERTNRAAGREREAVVRLCRIREGVEAKAKGRADLVLEVGYRYHTRSFPVSVFYRFFFLSGC
jgi:nuclear pore complex protein Nup93